MKKVIENLLFPLGLISAIATEPEVLSLTIAAVILACITSVAIALVAFFTIYAILRMFSFYVRQIVNALIIRGRGS